MIAKDGVMMTKESGCDSKGWRSNGDDDGDVSKRTVVVVIIVREDGGDGDVSKGWR